METKFCDGVLNVSIKSGVVRVDFFEYGPQKGDAEPEKKYNHRLVLTPEAFLQSHAAFQQVVDELLKRGVVKKK